MVLTRAGAKTLAVERRRRCIVVNEEAEDPSIPDLVPRHRSGPRPDNLWLDSSAYTVDFKSLSKGEQKTAATIVKFIEKHGILDCKSVIKNGGLATRDLLVEMASRQQEKLAERKAKKALRDSQKRSEAPESETDAADHNSKRIKVTIPRPPPHHKQLDNQSKGSSSTSLIGDKENSDANAERGPDGALTSTVAGEPGEVSASTKVDPSSQDDAGPRE
ncbi:hypothetical protein SESBI_10815 [Sesbania bispinosa]|nr:hypothetical protein SESBI_10815 [Sesbania bispinosa]